MPVFRFRDQTTNFVTFEVTKFGDFITAGMAQVIKSCVMGLKNYKIQSLIPPLKILKKQKKKQG